MTRPIMSSLIVALLGLSPAVTFAQTRALASRASLNSLHGSSDAIENLVGRVMPSVVQVTATGYRAQQDVNQLRTDVAVRRGQTIGSGVIIDSGGYILTNAHVIEGADQIHVILTGDLSASESIAGAGSRARVLPAHLAGKSDELDLALLTVDGSGLPALALADYNSVRQGELVFAFGSPDALRNSVSMGVVSAVAQPADSGRPLVWIQTDAAVNPGNSGGPLVNVDGEIVGLNTFIRSISGGSEGLGFAVPSAVIALAYPQLRDYGHLHRALLGLAVQQITPPLKKGLNLATDIGAIVADMSPGGPAATAGVQIGDVVTGIGGVSFDTMSLARLQVFLLTLIDGQQVRFDVLRGSRPLTLTVTAIVPAHRCERTGLVDVRANLVEGLGFLGASVDESVAQRLPRLRILSGVLVVARVDTLRAAELPLLRDDVIHAVNDIRVTTPSELREVLARFAVGDSIVLQVERNGELTYFAYDIE